MTMGFQEAFAAQQQQVHDMWVRSAERALDLAAGVVRGSVLPTPYDAPTRIVNLRIGQPGSVAPSVPQVGVPISAVFYSHDPDAAAPTFTYAWSADDTPIAGATAATFTPTVAEVGKTLSVLVTPSNGAAVTAVASGATQAAAPPPPDTPAEPAPAPAPDAPPES
jgi:hypothetical protein